MQSQNVVAELASREEGLVIVGGHYDVVPQTEAGANDNTSGVAVVLSLAEALAGRTLPFSVMFMAFGAEEVGLFGSGHYVSSLGDEELGSIKAMLNFDVVGTGPSIAVVGDGSLTGLALETAASLGINAERGMLPPGASSDHQSFQQVGVPVLVIWATDPSRIHTPQDRLEFVQPERLGDSFLVAQELLQSLEFGQ
jgi:aminopeptidase YwaD